MDITIREAQPSDAAQIVTYIHRLSAEPNSNIELSPGEFSRTVEEEAEFLADFAASENSVFYVAEIAGKIVGIINCRGGKRQAIRHAVLYEKFGFVIEGRRRKAVFRDGQFLDGVIMALLL